MSRGSVSASHDYEAASTQLAALHLSAHQLRAAQLKVCSHAHDVDDAAELLAALGLLPDPATETYR